MNKDSAKVSQDIVTYLIIIEIYPICFLALFFFFNSQYNILFYIKYAFCIVILQCYLFMIDVMVLAILRQDLMCDKFWCICKL